MSNVVFSNARARALENYLLGEERINRLIECQTPEDAIKILSEVNFGDGVSITSALDFEKLLYAEKNKLYEFIKSTCASKTLVDFMLLKSDYHNAETLIKQKHLKIAVDEMLDSEGNFEIDYLKEKIMIDDYSNFSNQLKSALMYSDAEFVSGKATGPNISNAFIKAYFDELYEIASRDSVLKNIYTVKADCVNVSIALRLRNFNEAKACFVKFGKISEGDLKRLCEEQLEPLKEIFKFTHISEMVLSAIDSLIEGRPFSDFEKMADEYAVKLMLKDKYATDGILPFMQYCYYKLADISNVRIIMVGLINGMNKTDIRNRLRAYYER
jgi:V/A-type H+-transporting ATPase subunit C